MNCYILPSPEKHFHDENKLVPALLDDHDICPDSLFEGFFDYEPYLRHHDNYYGVIADTMVVFHAPDCDNCATMKFVDPSTNVLVRNRTFREAMQYLEIVAKNSELIIKYDITEYKLDIEFYTLSDESLDE